MHLFFSIINFLELDKQRSEQFVWTNDDDNCDLH